MNFTRLKRGFVAPQMAIFIAVLVLAGVLAANRQLIYQTYQNTAYKIGVNVNNIASDKYVSFIKSQNGEKDTASEGIFLNQKFSYLEYNLASLPILGESTDGKNKKIVVDISEQRLYMKEGDSIVGTFLVSTGKWAPTPRGEWPIWIKLRYARMTGGSKEAGTFYDLPNVPYTMYFNQGYGVHGAYWHNNFGQPMSHGCINMRPEEAGIVFNWAEVGTPVNVID